MMDKYGPEKKKSHIQILQISSKQTFVLQIWNGQIRDLLSYSVVIAQDYDTIF